MTRGQKIVLAVGLLVLAVPFLFPNWMMVRDASDHGARLVLPLGRAWCGSPPPETAWFIDVGSKVDSNEATELLQRSGQDFMDKVDFRGPVVSWSGCVIEALIVVLAASWAFVDQRSRRGRSLTPSFVTAPLTPQERP